MEIEDQEQEILLQPEQIVIAPVTSVNGKTGDVVLTTSDLENDSNYQNANDVSNSISAHNQSTSAHQDIRQLITDEATTRFNADNALQGQIDAITSASDVVDIVGTYAELEAYGTQHLKDNDVIKVLQDETHNDAMTYYRWSTHTETWTYIGAEGPYYTKSETNTLLDDKLDKSEVPDGFFDGPATITPIASTNVTIEGSIKLKDLDLLGDSSQQTYSGKNIVDINATPTLARTTVSVDGNSITVTSDNTTNTARAELPIIYKADTTMTISYDVEILANETSSTSGIVYLRGSQTGNLLETNFPLVVGQTYHRTATLNGGSTDTNKNLWLYIKTSTVAGVVSVKFSNIQIEYSDTATSYEPYVGAQPAPNPDYPQTVNVVTGTQTIKTTGKNLMPLMAGSASLNGIDLTIDSNGIITINGTSTDSLNIKISNGVIANNSSTIPTTWLDENIGNINDKTLSIIYQSGSFTSSGVAWRIFGDTTSYLYQWYPSSSAITQTFTSSQSASCFGFFIGANKTFNNYKVKIQLENGSTATDYVPYIGQSYTVNLGTIELCKIGTYQDYIYKSGNDWYVHKEIGKAIFDGSEAWAHQSNYDTANRLLFEVNNPGNKISGDNITNRVGVSNEFVYRLQLQNSTVDVTGFQFNTNETYSKYVYVKLEKSLLGTQDATGFKTWLSNNNMIVYYQMSPATDTKITDDTLIGQLNALLNATLYQPTTIMSSSGSLPAILKIEAFTDNLNSLLEIASEPTPEPVTYDNFVGTDGVNAGTAGLVPAPATTDAGKFLKADGTWDTAGGSSVTVVQTTGTSQTDVMSQNATSSIVFADPGTNTKIKIGSGASVSAQSYNMAVGPSSNANGNSAVAIGASASSRANGTALGVSAKAGNTTSQTAAVAIGYNAQALGAGAVAIGRDSTASSQGELNIGTSSTIYGYNSSNYRLISGVYDGQNAQDAVTVNQVNATIDAINTALGTSIPHIGA